MCRLLSLFLKESRPILFRLGKGRNGILVKPLRSGFVAEKNQTPIHKPEGIWLSLHQSVSNHT
jgi:hypothetical protein